MADEQIVEQEVESNPLEDIFPDRHPLATEQMGEEAPTETPSEAPAEVMGEEAPTETPSEQPGPEATPTSDEAGGLKAALAAERRKRQELEAQIAQQQQAPAPQQQEEQAFDWSNPEKTLQTVEARMNQTMQVKLINMSVAQARSRHEDYDEMQAEFLGLVKQNPAYYNSMLQADDPAEYAYQTAKQTKHMQEVGADPAAYRAKLEAEIRAELEAEFNQKIDAKIKKAQGLPPSAKKMRNQTPTDPAPNVNPLEALFPGQIAS